MGLNIRKCVYSLLISILLCAIKNAQPQQPLESHIHYSSLRQFGSEENESPQLGRLSSPDLNTIPPQIALLDQTEVFSTPGRRQAASASTSTSNGFTDNFDSLNLSQPRSEEADEEKKLSSPLETPMPKRAV